MASRSRSTHLAGVRQVTNNIEIEPPKVASSAVRAAIESALQRHATREAHRIGVEIKDGVVTLRGTVRSWSERTAAVGAATGTPGVRNVIDQLHLEL